MHHRDAYYNAEAEISDAEFDALVDELTRIDPNDPAITMVGAKVRPSEWKKVAHRIPMGSLNKVNAPEEMRNWIEKSIDDKDHIFWTEKMDGLSISLNYDSGELTEAILRGGGDGIGEDILSNVVKMHGVKQRLPFSGSLRGEIVLHSDDFEKHFSDNKNPRNIASGVSRRLDGEGSNHLTVYFYQAIADDKYPEVAQDTHAWTTEYEQLEFIKWLGLNTPRYGLIEGSNEAKFAGILAIWNDYQEKTRETLNYLIDGLVISHNSLSTQAEMGETNQRPKGKIAWKFANQAIESEVVGIEWTTKKSGRLSPTVLIKPTKILGTIVDRASLYNYDYITKLQLGIGCCVSLVKAGDIIPKIVSVLTPAKEVFPLPTLCPECGSNVVRDNIYIECVGAKQGICIGQKTGIVNSWIKNLGVMEWGTSLIEKLFDSGLINDIADLYTLSVDDLAGLDRMGETSARKAYNELWKVSEVPLHTFIGSIGIPNVGRTTIEIAMDNGRDTLTKLFAASETDYANMKGIGSVKAKALYEGLRDKEDLIKRILENGVSIMAKEEKKSVVGGKLNGIRICITGKTELKRDLWKERIESAGGIFEKAVKSGTNYLVIVDPDSTTVKANSARALGVKLIDESELEQIVSS
jgi:DNA ligase (NAD+)